MKNIKQIEEKINLYKKEANKLQGEIQECLQIQKEQYSRFYPDCDFITERQDRIVMLEAKISTLIWVLS